MSNVITVKTTAGTATVSRFSSYKYADAIRVQLPQWDSAVIFSADGTNCLKLPPVAARLPIYEEALELFLAAEPAALEAAADAAVVAMLDDLTAQMVDVVLPRGTLFKAALAAAKSCRNLTFSRGGEIPCWSGTVTVSERNKLQAFGCTIYPFGAI